MITDLTVAELAKAIAAKQISAAQAAQAYLERIERFNPKLNAYLSVFADQALAAARAIDQKIAAGQPVGALAGVPVAIKDNICAPFGPTTCGSKILANYRSPFTATAAQRLLAADAVILGKTNLDEFGMGSSTENSAFGPTRNPWDLSRVPGGSSGGSAAAVAAGLAAAALGSDTGGSIRQPASFCGITGLKPTYGRVSRYGLVAYGSSLDQIGPMTKTVEDAALILSVIAGHDPADSTSAPEAMAARPDYRQNLSVFPKNLKIAVAPQLNEGAQPAVRDALNAALKQFQSLGAQIVDVQLPHFDYAIATYYLIATAEASSNLARYDGVHYGYRSPDAEDYVAVYTRSRDEGFGAEVKRRIMLGTFALSSGYYDAYYLKALKARNLIRQDFANVFRQADCLALPTSPTTAFALGEKTADPLQMYLADVYTIAVNLAGVPALSVPCGFDEQGLPIGMQLIGAPFEEIRLLQIAYGYQQATKWHCRRPLLD